MSAALERPRRHSRRGRCMIGFQGRPVGLAGLGRPFAWNVGRPDLRAAVAMSAALERVAGLSTWPLHDRLSGRPVGLAGLSRPSAGSRPP